MTSPWALAIRPRTLGASVIPVIVGVAYAAHSVVINVPVALLTGIAALSLQIATNLANDYYDYKSGIDSAERLGPTRVSQAGLLPAESVKRGAYTAVGVALLIGFYLVYVGGLAILAIGLLAAITALAYSAGPAPLASLGFGEALAFVFFGVVAVLGTIILQGAAIDTTAVLLSLPIASLVTAIMVVNNLRDIPTDRETGKNTLAVRLGDRGTRAAYTVLVGFAYAILLLLAGTLAWSVIAPLMTAPLAIQEVRRLWTRSGAELNESLAGTARLHLSFGLALTIGLLL